MRKRFRDDSVGETVIYKALGMDFREGRCKQSPPVKGHKLCESATLVLKCAWDLNALSRHISGNLRGPG